MKMIIYKQKNCINCPSLFSFFFNLQCIRISFILTNTNSLYTNLFTKTMSTWCALRVGEYFLTNGTIQVSTDGLGVQEIPTHERKKNQACYSLKLFFVANYEFSSKLHNHLDANTKSGTVMKGTISRTFYLGAW